ncbi:hypothetical protein [Actinomadura luteofluorescens]|uniref:hypothetical protein n=1 Tax=Actinomadura luteofluorescens TaxID=46163 RepID=UPI003D918741
MGDRALKDGDRVVVVEHDDATRRPREGGRRFPARVVKTEGIYIQVDYLDRTVNRGRPDVFFKESLWRAWDGAFRWRLTAEGADHDRS